MFVKALLEAIGQLQPRPNIPVELIKYLGKNFAAWHISAKMLEDQLIQITNEVKTQKENDLSLNNDLSLYELALADLYHCLNEDDLYYRFEITFEYITNSCRSSIWKSRASTNITKVALTLEQHGMWQKSQEAFFEAMTNAQNGIIK
jgi:transformation/transcription domain-associated protein